MGSVALQMAEIRAHRSLGSFSTNFDDEVLAIANDDEDDKLEITTKLGDRQ
jgi:hypothetical protein